jgi:hypothetical protein
LVTEHVIGLYILGAVALGAIVAAGLALDGGLARRAGAIMKPQSGEAPWAPAIRVIDEALVRGDMITALRTWSEAYGEAQRSRRWERLMAMGDARLRIIRAPGPQRAAEAKAREVYLAALFHARQEGSLDGVLRAAEAFEALGDTQVAEQALRMAEAMAGPDAGPAVQARLAVLREGLAVRLAITPRGREGLLAEP